MKLPIVSFLFFLLLLTSTSASQPPYSCDKSNPSTKTYPFCKTTLPISERVNNLISLLTLDEKISQLGSTSPAIPRLGIPAYEWWSESLHGVATFGKGIQLNGTIPAATTFPQVILTAASFDPNLWYRIGHAIGIEARAVYNAGQAKGMTFWAPNINVFRDPRWGRGQETPGEDPLMTGTYAVYYVRGIQGDSFQGGNLGDTLQASACCKHFTAYDLENWNGNNRFTFDAFVSKQDLADTFQPPFQTCVQNGNASGVMCAYNRVNGVPACADYNLLTKTVRGQWGFHGYITSDCDAVAIIYEDQKIAKTPEDAVAAVLKAGMDVNCGSYLQNYTKSAVQARKVSEADINRAFYNLFSIRMKLGLFNGNPVENAYGNINSSSVCSKEHLDLALEAAHDGIVLLKNTDNLLPLPRDGLKSIAVIGPNANVSQTLLGNYIGLPCKRITPFQAIKSYAKYLYYDSGCDSVSCPSYSSSAVKLAVGVDRVILIMGLDQTQEREEKDRMDLVLPGMQRSLIESVANASPTPVILVVLSGGPVDIEFAKNNPKIGSIIWGGYPGEAGGIALADVIFGLHNPGGRLPMTWYPQGFTKVAMTNMRMRPDAASKYPGRTYRFYQGRKVFEFGYGLSYSTFSYRFSFASHTYIYLNQFKNLQPTVNKDSVRQLSVSDIGTEICGQVPAIARVWVTNTGEMPGKHSVLLFARQSKVGPGSPVKQLVGFQSVYLKAGEQGTVEFGVEPCKHLSRANEDGVMVIEEGTYFLVVGDVEHPVTVVLAEVAVGSKVPNLQEQPADLILIKGEETNRNKHQETPTDQQSRAPERPIPTIESS